jgi:hypothetical protein
VILGFRTAAGHVAGIGTDVEGYWAGAGRGTGVGARAQGRFCPPWAVAAAPREQLLPRVQVRARQVGWATRGMG